MPIEATRIAEPATEVPVVDPALVQPRVSQYEGRPVLGRRQALLATQCQRLVVDWTARHPETGDPVNLRTLGLTSLASSSSSSSSSETTRVVVRALEALYTSGQSPMEIVGTVERAEAGLCRFQLSEPLVRCPGVYVLEIGFLDQAGQLLFSNRVYLLVERGLFGELARGGPPTFQEIKLAVRDSAPEDSYLNEQVEWDLAEVCDAIVAAVRYWNEAPPPVARRNTSTFEFRENWKTAILARLYMMAAASYRREAVQYQAAGVALNDKAKAPEYERRGQELEADFRGWVKVTKVRFNMEAGFGRVGLYRV